MSDLVKREITELAPNGSNYLSWSLDAEIVLDGKNLLHAIKPTNDKIATSAERAQALHFLRHHISSSLKNVYMTERDPIVLWNALHERFEKMETILLPRVKREWQNLRYQDYKTVEEYNAKLYAIVTRMKLCGLKLTESDLIEKTLSTFHPKQTYLSRQYKKEKYKKYIDLSNALQQDQGEDEELMQNHLTRPTGSLSKPEANAVSSSQKNEGKGKESQKAPWKGKNQKFNNFKKKGQWKSKKIPPGGEYELNGQLKKRKTEHEAHFVSSRKFEQGESSKSKEMEIDSSKHEEKNEAPAAEENPEDMLVDIKPTDTMDEIMKNLENKIQQDDDDDLLGEELEDMHGDSV
ncbi:uncharacterized protein LOC120702094 [Panicum virgatum]|uniref:uncharacterized protein LOC120702094 n=1 Tax=Panicum virgatum TaxID=38727 RepID=UPI0019D56FF8|nr:uncharacterized protein LOC120702094 [Panicum virgatum]